MWEGFYNVLIWSLLITDFHLSQGRLEKIPPAINWGSLYRRYISAANNASLVCSPIAICPQGCRNGGLCVAPGICSCPEGWLGGACHIGKLDSTPIPSSNGYNITAQCTMGYIAFPGTIGDLLSFLQLRIM